MAWNGLTLTTSGRRALSKAQADGSLKIHSIAVGDGAPPGNFNALEALVNQRFEITELSIDITDTGCVITGDFPKAGYNYYFRELGVTVETSEGIKLYAYDNCGTDAEYIVDTSTIESTSKRIRIELVFSNVANVTVSNPSVLYVSYEDLDNKVSGLKTEVYKELEKKAANLTFELFKNETNTAINALRDVRIVEVKVNEFTPTAPHTLRINIAGIKETDRPEVAHYLLDGVTDAGVIKGAWKSYSCIDKVKTHDGYIEVICFRKKPTQNVWLMIKGG